MGKVREQHVGVIQGKLGPQVFRLRKGKHIVGRTPRPSEKPVHETLIKNRMKFTNNALFCNAVLKVPFFKQVWDMTTPNNISPYNGIFRANYINVTTSDVMDSALIVPEYGDFDVTTQDVSVDGASVNVTLDPLGSSMSIDASVEKYIRMGVVIKCTDGVKEGLPNLVFFSEYSDRVMLNVTNPLNFSVNLQSPNQKRYANYDTHLAFIAFVTMDEFGNPVKFSNSIKA